MTDSTTISKTTPTEPWYASTGFWASAIMLVVAILQVAAAISAASTFAGGVAAVDWTAWALGAAGLAVGIVRAVKGLSPDFPTPRWTMGGGARNSTSTTVVMLVMGAALAIMVALSSCAPGAGGGRLTPQQGQAVSQGVQIGCQMAKLLLRPDVTGVSPDVAAWVDRLCNLGELVTVAVLPWVVGDSTPAPAPLDKRLFLEVEPPVRTVALSCEQMAAGCDQDGLDTPTAETCYEVLRGCREGRAAVLTVAHE